MALNDQARQLIDAANELALPAIETLDAATARSEFDFRTARVPRPDVSHVSDSTFVAPDGADVPIRTYRAVPTDLPAPAIVFFHGGGWVIGTIDTHDAVCRALAIASGATVVSVGYRLAPEHPYPAAVDDCVAATVHVAANGSSFGIDPARLAVGGDSAGGNLAAVVAQSVGDHGIELSAQFLVYPMTELSDYRTNSFHTHGEGLLLTAAGIDWFIDHYVADGDRRIEPACSPARGEVGVSPPTLIVLAECDPLYDDGIAYSRALAAAGVPVELVELPGQVHTFFTQVGIMDDSLRAVELIAEFLDSAWSQA